MEQEHYGRGERERESEERGSDAKRVGHLCRGEEKTSSGIGMLETRSVTRDTCGRGPRESQIRLVSSTISTSTKTLFRHIEPATRDREYTDETHPPLDEKTKTKPCHLIVAFFLGTALLPSPADYGFGTRCLPSSVLSKDTYRSIWGSVSVHRNI